MGPLGATDGASADPELGVASPVPLALLLVVRPVQHPPGMDRSGFVWIHWIHVDLLGRLRPRLPPAGPVATGRLHLPEGASTYDVRMSGWSPK